MQPSSGTLFEVTSRNGHAIQSLDDWATLGKPAAAEHWKPGRSAYELAREWIEGDAASRLTALLSASPALEGIELVRGIAEKQTHFDEIGRGPRNHDLLVEGRIPAGPVVVAVEGKADEPFDLPLWRWRAQRLAKSGASAAPARLDALTLAFFGTTIDRDTRYPPIACLGYQLISALAGLVADAKEFGASHGVLVIHEFATAQTTPERRAVNARVLDDFVERLGRGRAGKSEHADGWLTNPIEVQGSNALMPVVLPVTVAKLESA